MIEKQRPQRVRKEGGGKCQERVWNRSAAGTVRRTGLRMALWIGKKVTRTSGGKTVIVTPGSKGLRSERDT